MADKDFKTIDEQIEILRSRGLTIEDEAEAKDFLLRNNYYRVSGYSLTLRKNDVFAKSATFQNIEDIYNFDHEFRHRFCRCTIPCRPYPDHQNQIHPEPQPVHQLEYPAYHVLLDFPYCNTLSMIYVII